MSLQKFIQNIPLDKKEHIVLGVIYSLLMVLGGFFGSYGVYIGFAIGTALNVWKEVWNDWRNGNGTPELMDFLATELPLLITLAVYLA
jgi:hypothetical protein